MEKIIHYCWFGGKPLPKLAKKCIKSWKKYLPDYEIKEWNEKNFDINICPFVKGAYENKKWAFVADYARMYAVYNEGGIYFDTDMEIINKIDFLKEKDVFIGYEENRVIAVGVLGVKERQNKYIKDVLDYYNSRTEFNMESIWDYSIPKLITKIWSKYDKKIENGIDILDDKIFIYPEDYFYPINYNYSKKNYTENTCMIHYYNATWVPKEEKIAVTVYRIFGKKLGRILLKTYYSLCNIKNRIISKIKQKMFSLKMFVSIHFNRKKRVRNFAAKLEEIGGDYIAISHPDWKGVGNVAKDKFEYNITLREQYTKKEAMQMAKKLIEYNKKLIIFNGFAMGWEDIAKEIKKLKNDIIVKVLWHGSHALLVEDYDWNVYATIIKLYKNNIIDEIGFVKKSMYDFYKAKGYNVSFIMNTVNIEDREKYLSKNRSSNSIKVGLYSSGDRWVKNTYNQLSAVSLIENAELNCIPLNPKIRELASFLDLSISGTEQGVGREKLFEYMANNDINIYVTFTECAPLIPLESLELGVPCITGDNHHYFEGTELEKYLVVNKEDNIIEIYEKIKFAIENKEEIMQLYKKWKTENEIRAKESNNNFIDIRNKGE